MNKFAEFVKMCNVTPVDSLIIDEAIASQFRDFEDAMQYYSAIREGADAIITRNIGDFEAAQIDVYEPQQFLNMLTGQ
jgi:predicted nucleic acid-binding protein